MVAKLVVYYKQNLMKKKRNTYSVVPQVQPVVIAEVEKMEIGKMMGLQLPWILLLLAS